MNSGFSFLKRKRAEGYVLQKADGRDDEDVVVPSEFDGGKVVKIGGGAFRGHKDIRTVTIGDGVETIGRDAFRGCGEIESVSIPGSVRFIGIDAFSGCAIGEVRIDDLSAWCSIRFAGPTSNPLRRAKRIFVGGEEAYDLVIPEGVERIGDYAFNGCRAVMSVTLPESLREIGREAFKGCCGLMAVCNRSPLETEADVGDKRNGYVAYYAKRIYPAGAVLSGKRFERDGYVFYDSPDGLFLTDSLRDEREAILPLIEGREYEIAPDVFSDREDLYDAYIPRSVTAIGRAAFHGCGHLRHVRMGKDVRHIGDFAFEDCIELEHVNFPESLETIGDYSFRGCRELRCADLPDGVRSIGERAFNKCYALSDVTIPGDIEEIGRCAFQELNRGREVYFNCRCDKERLLELVTGKDGLECTNGCAWFPDGRTEDLDFFHRIKRRNRSW